MLGLQGGQQRRCTTEPVKQSMSCIGGGGEGREGWEMGKLWDYYDDFYNSGQIKCIKFMCEIINLIIVIERT